MRDKILILMSALIFCSCAYTHKATEPNIPFSSFIRIEAARHETNCITCVLEGGYGSGSKIGDRQVLTAGHICAGIRDMLDNAAQSSIHDKVTVVMHDDAGNTYGATGLNMHPAHDVCIIKTDRPLLNDAIELATNTTSRGRSVWSMMAPNGISGVGIVPIMSGHYVGGDAHTSIYTIPAHPGSSGGPILNASGEVLGIVSQINKDFHHIVISPSLSVLHKFVLSSQEEDQK